MKPMLERNPNGERSLSFYSVNLEGGENCSEPLHFYQSIVGGEVLKESFGHAELLVFGTLRMVFSKQTEGCPVRPGTITLEWEKGKENDPKLQKFKILQSHPTKAYSLYEDPWGNWVWVYFSK
ncbi:VOC family protein [Leptospira yanagawae]|uniref:VOC family protein n=2 Tax=Leptospira yanagawae TaxID=293069 RepID=A0ABY2LY59_9LEPT|nr:VOC family protein [Leptospira yanagawae]TGL18675.1 VOC family protein [Leptospira yanagawae]